MRLASPLREWEQKHEKDLEDLSRKETQEKQDARSTAISALQTWCKERNESITKRKAQNRADEATMAPADKSSATNPWERVVELIDTNARVSDDSRDTSRMRALLIQLKSAPVSTFVK
mmetsp:Transcript_5292/g.7395  ORF Transcript_5292/g.7395 Transcript_5292/m.7395 type:complete len:118 (-) Transcript_5292:73-426(-)